MRPVCWSSPCPLFASDSPSVSSYTTGNVGVAPFKQWIAKARSRAHKHDRELVADQTITAYSRSIVIDREPAPLQVIPPGIRSPSNGHLHADIDLIDTCNLECPTCWRGVGAQKNTPTTMPLVQFREITKKVRTEGYPNFALINWTEPFLLRTLHEYIPAVKEAGLDCWLSSNLSLPPEKYLPTIIAALAAGVDILFVSVSGYTQPVYEINHKRGRVEWIKTNLEGIGEQLGSGKVKTSVWIRYLEFPYNSHEKEPWAAFAMRLGIGFDPVLAYGDPKDPLPPARIFQRHLSEQLRKVATHDRSLESFQIPNRVCSLIADRVAIDAKGDAYLCCAYPNAPELRIGRYVDLTEGELLLRRHMHSFCETCEIPARRELTSEDRARFTKALEECLAHSSTGPKEPRTVRLTPV